MWLIVEGLTVKLLSEPEAVERLHEALAAVAGGDFTSQEDMARLMAERNARG